MTTYYVGPGGSDAANGLSWANRKLTPNGVEDVPVVAGDTVYVSPGVYRELLTIDVSGSAGNPITYIADVTGEHTDGIGGVVRITGSDNDQTATRANCITATSKDYRTFTGFAFDTTTSHLVSLITACSNWIIQDCCFAGEAAAVQSINLAGTGTTNTIRRCLFDGARAAAVQFTHSVAVDNAAHVIENCRFVGTLTSGIQTVRVGGITVKNCVFIACNNAPIRVTTAITVGQTITVNNCILAWSSVALNGTVTGEIVENYNTFWGNVTDRTNTATGANSVTYPPLFAMPFLLAGIKYPPPAFGELSQWSQVAAKAGTGEATDGIFGMARPATSAKKSWGAIQFVPMLRETTTKRTGAASLRLSDAGRHQMFVPVTAVSTVFSVYVQWEADYAGTKPQMIIKQPGQSDTTVTATGSSGSWEQLTTTITPAALPPYVVVEFVSSNTAAATNFDCFFDDFTVS